MIEDMHVTHTLRADLNLIPALAVLLEERHVSRAAQRLGLSQPAMSRALQRLRLQIGDPLLIRERDGYRLSARARTLQAQLDRLIPGLEALVSPDSFDPATTTEPIDVAGTDFAVLTYGAAICHRVMSEAPSAPVRFHSWRYDSVAEQIQRGTADVGLFGGFASDDLSGVDLHRERFVCVLDPGHPAAGYAELTLAHYCRLRHLVVDVAEGVQPDIDFRLDAEGLGRDAVITVPYHAAVPPMLAGTDLVATIPASLAGTWPDTYAVRIVAAPPQIRHMTYRMVWHKAYDDDRRHRWLRATIRDAIAATVSAH